jgi:small subunit ribosomal protein S18
MSEELNPTTEETTSNEVTAETTTTSEAASEAPVAEAETTTEAEAPAQTEAAPSSASAEDSASAEEENVGEGNVVPLGPSEYVADPQAGGRSRRTSVNADINDIDYKNVALLSRFIDQRGRILSRRKTRVSAVMQRRVVKAIKLARHLALLPYTADQTRVVRKRR